MYVIYVIYVLMYIHVTSTIIETCIGWLPRKYKPLECSDHQLTMLKLLQNIGIYNVKKYKNVYIR